MIKDLSYIIRGDKLSYISSTVFGALILGIEALAQPLIMKAIFDNISSHRAFRYFVPIALTYLVLAVSMNVLLYFSYVWQTNVSKRIIIKANRASLSAFYNVSFQELLENGSGHYIARIRSDIKDGLEPMLVALREAVVGAVSFTMLITVLIYISYAAFAALVGIIPLCVLVSHFVSKRIRALTAAERDNEAVIVDILVRSVAAFKIVREFSLRKPTIETYNRVVAEGADWSFKKARMVRLLQTASDMTRAMSDVSSIFVGGFLVISRKMTVGSFIGFMNAFWRSSSTLFLLINKSADIHSYTPIVERIADFQRRNETAKAYTVGSSVSVKDVSFSYGSASIISHLSVAAKPAERIILAGPNGSGKSTLGNILSGRLPVNSGAITLPEIISGVTLPISFPALAVGRLGVNESILERFGIADPNIIGGTPDNLSVGQQQKLAIALALSKTAEMYIFDEPLSNVDVESRDDVLMTILEKTQGAILIVIAHDFASYIHHFDRLINISELQT